MSSPRPGMPGVPDMPGIPRKRRNPRLVVDPKPGNRVGPNPPKLKSKPQPMKPLPVDDVMLRKMPITQSQLGQIKKYYGI